MGRRIKALTKEISLAFNPANEKKFFMKKEAEGMYGHLIEILEKDPEPKELEQLNAFLDTFEDLSKEARTAISGCLTIFLDFWDMLPEGFVTALSKDVPFYAKLVSDEIPEDVLENIKENLKKEMEADMGNDEKIAVMEKQLADVSDQLQETSTELKKTQEDLENERKDRRTLELKNMYKDAGIPGDLDRHVRTHMALEDVSEEVSKEYFDSQKEFAEKLVASGLLKDVGSSGDGDDTSTSESRDAESKLKQLKKELMEKDSELSEADAWKKVIKDNPDLFRKYRG